MLTAPRIVRTDRAVRPCFPMTLPTSCGATLSFRTVFSSRPTASTSTASGSSTRARAISRTSSSTATLSCWVMHLPLTVRVQIVVKLNGARIVSQPAPRGRHFCPRPVKKGLGDGRLGCRGSCRVLGHQLFHGGRKPGADAAPVGDALVLQVDRGRVGAGVVGADHLDGTAVAGAVLLDDHDTVVGLLAGAKSRQTNHYHGDTVPFRFLCSVAVYGAASDGRRRIGGVLAKRKARQIVRPAQDSTSKYRRKRAVEANRTRAGQAIAR